MAEQTREPLKTTTVLIALTVDHHGGVTSEQLTSKAHGWLNQNMLDLGDRMGGSITQVSVTTAKERLVSESGRTSPFPESKD